MYSLKPIAGHRDGDVDAFARAARTVVESVKALGVDAFDHASARSLALIALPVAIAAAARDVPSFVLDAVHDAVCALIVAKDLCQRAFVDPAGRPESKSRAGAGGGAPAVEKSTFGALFLRGGGAWACLEALRLLLEDAVRPKARETYLRRDWDHAFQLHEILTPPFLECWATSGVINGAANDADPPSDETSIATAKVVAAGLRAVRGHETSTGDAGLRSLSNALTAAARLAPSGEACAELHAAVEDLFARRKFAPLTRGHGRRSVGGPIASWPQWLYAVGAPPPLDAAAASAASAALADGAEEYERLEASAASIRAKMSRLGDAMRSLTADVRISTQFHREPARALLREAHAEMGWRREVAAATTSAEDGTSTSSVADGDDDATAGESPSPSPPRERHHHHHVPHGGGAQAFILPHGGLESPSSAAATAWRRRAPLVLRRAPREGWEGRAREKLRRVLSHTGPHTTASAW